jgi:hypothetical protein
MAPFVLLNPGIAQKASIDVHLINAKAAFSDARLALLIAAQAHLFRRSKKYSAHFTNAGTRTD